MSRKHNFWIITFLLIALFLVFGRIAGYVCRSLPRTQAYQPYIARDCSFPANQTGKDPAAFRAAYQALESKRDLLILLDTEHAIPANFRTSPLIMHEGIFITPPTQQMLSFMQRAAKNEGIDLFPLSGFRSYKRQKELLERTASPQYVADPGHSQHQLGTAIDFNTVDPKDENIPALQWLRQHAGQFGFSLSFPKGKQAETGYPYEAWHYRYISQEAVAFQDEFFDGDQHAMLVFLHRCLWPEQEKLLRKNSQKIKKKEQHFLQTIRSEKK